MNIRIGQILLDSGMISNKQLENALNQQNEGGARLGYYLVSNNAISENDLNKFLARQQNIESANLDEIDIDENIIRLISGDIARRYEVIPIEIVGKKLIVAMTDPHNLFAIDDLRFSLGMDIEPHITASSMIRRALARYYPDSDALVSVDDSGAKVGSTVQTSITDIIDEEKV